MHFIFECKHKKRNSHVGEVMLSSKVVFLLLIARIPTHVLMAHHNVDMWIRTKFNFFCVSRGQQFLNRALLGISLSIVVSLFRVECPGRSLLVPGSQPSAQPSGTQPDALKNKSIGVFTLVTRGWAASEFLTRASKFNMTPNGAN